MAKSKHTINDIQKALLSNTRFIREEEAKTEGETSEKVLTSHPDTDVTIDPIILKKIRILAHFQGETPSEMINKALNHFLRLKSMQLDQAIAKLTEEE